MVCPHLDNSPFLSVDKKWATEFKRGIESLEGDPNEGKFLTVTTQKNINYNHNMIIADGRRLTLHYTAQELRMPKECVGLFITDQLCEMGSKVSSTRFNTTLHVQGISPNFYTDPNLFQRYVKKVLWVMPAGKMMASVF